MDPRSEAQRAFWQAMFGANSNQRHLSKNRPGFASYFMRLREGATIELMTLPELEAGQTGQEMTGWAHIAIAPGDEHQVDEMAVRAAESGILIAPSRRRAGLAIVSMRQLSAILMAI